MTHVHDAIVVGSGCAGGWVAKVLTEAGLDVLMLEAGPHIESTALAPDTWSGASSGTDTNIWKPASTQSIQSQHPSFRRANSRFFVNDVEHPYSTPAGKPFHWIRGRQVGGRSLTWGRLCLRLSQLEMAAGSMDGLSADWPISYEDLAPHYSAVERYLGVRGSKEGLAHLPDGDYLPPAPLTPGEQWLRDEMAKAWPDRKVIPARGVDCDTYPEMPWPKFTSTGSTLAAAKATGRLRLQPDSVVRQLSMLAGSRKAEGVHWIDRSNFAEYEARARVVVMCASTIETARVLLNSSTRGHSNGPGNASDVLGRYLMDHPFALICGRGDFPPAAGVLPLAGPHGIMIPRFRNLTDREDRGYTRGFSIWGGIDRAGLSDGGFLLIAQGEMLPTSENRVTLSRSRCDRWGMPLAHIECEWGQNDKALMADALGCLREISARMGLEVETTVELSSPGQFVHEVGTARMGSDPQRSFVNADGQSWAVENLFVADGAAWTTSGYQNPTLTTMALARRCALGIVSKIREGRF